MTYTEFLTEWNSANEWISVQTSGSTGTPKPMLVEKKRMLASAQLTCDFLHLQPGNTALLCMPLNFIAGKMMVVRALERQLKLIEVPPSSHPLASLKGQQLDFAAMVPLQVWHSLEVTEEAETLRSIRHLLIGGGAIDTSLEAILETFPNTVWSSYGMTETLSHIALRRLNGTEASLYYTPFKQVKVSLSKEETLVIEAPLITPERLVTNDLAEILPDARFRILGRRDNVICSGGLKLQIEEIEALLHPLIPMPFAITSQPDPQLGEAVVLVLESTSLPASETLQEWFACLPKYWHPRHTQCIDKIPLTESGKIKRKAVKELIQRK